MKLFTVDRFEDGDIAVLEEETGEHILVARSLLPAETTEDSILSLIESAEGEPATYRLEPSLTAKRKEDMTALRSSLPKGPSGDIEL